MTHFCSAKILIISQIRHKNTTYFFPKINPRLLAGIDSLFRLQVGDEADSLGTVVFGMEALKTSRTDRFPPFRGKLKGHKMTCQACFFRHFVTYFRQNVYFLRLCLEDRLHLNKSKKITFFLVLSSICTTFATEKIEITNKHIKI